MANLENALQQLRAEQREAQLHVEKFGQAISVIESLHGSGSSHKQANRSELVAASRSENGAGAEGEMGECSEGITASGSGRLGP